jgi:hypothetical protein
MKSKLKCPLTAEQFNTVFPIGLEVKYYPVLSLDDYVIAYTTTNAVDMYGTPVIGLNIGGACYSVANIEPTGYVMIEGNRYTLPERNCVWN